MSKSRTKSCRLAPYLLVGALAACVDDGDDGKASAFTVVSIEPDGGTAVDSADGSVALTTMTLKLSCRKTVVSEHTLAGFSVQVLDAFGRPPPAPGPWISLSPSTGVLVTQQAGGGYADARGLLEFAFAAPHFDLPTPITLEATARGEDGQIVASDRCAFSLVTEGLAFAAPESNALVRHGQAEPVMLKVIAEDVPPRCAEAGGVKLGFVGAARGGFSASPTDPPSGSLCLDVPADGLLQFWLRGASAGGTARVEARALNYRAELPLQVVGAPSGISLKADSSDLTVDSAANLTVRVVDDVGQGVAGVAVSLELTRCAALECGTGEMLSQRELVTQADGSASAAYFAGSAAGAAQVTARVGGAAGVESTTVLRVR